MAFLAGFAIGCVVGGAVVVTLLLTLLFYVGPPD